VRWIEIANRPSTPTLPVTPLAEPHQFDESRTRRPGESAERPSMDEFRDMMIANASEMVRRRLAAVRGADARTGRGERLLRCCRDVTREGRRYRCGRPFCAPCGQRVANKRTARVLLPLCEAAIAEGWRLLHATVLLSPTDDIDTVGPIFQSAKRRIASARKRLAARHPDRLAFVMDGMVELGLLADNELPLAGAAKRRTLLELGFPEGPWGTPVWLPHIHAVLLVPPGQDVDDLAAEFRTVFAAHRQVHMQDFGKRGRLRASLFRIGRYAAKFRMLTDAELPECRRSWSAEEAALALDWSERFSNRGTRGLRFRIGAFAASASSFAALAPSSTPSSATSSRFDLDVAETSHGNDGRTSSKNPAYLNCGAGNAMAAATVQDLSNAKGRSTHERGAAGLVATGPSPDALSKIGARVARAATDLARDVNAVELIEDAADDRLVRPEHRHDHREGCSVAGLAVRPKEPDPAPQHEHVRDTEQEVVEHRLVNLRGEQQNDDLGLARLPRRERAADIGGGPGERRVHKDCPVPRLPQSVFVNAMDDSRANQRSGSVAGVEVERPPQCAPEGLHDGWRCQPRIPAPGPPASPLLGPHARVGGEQAQERLKRRHAAPACLHPSDGVLGNARPPGGLGNGPTSPLTRGPHAPLEGWAARRGEPSDPHVEGVEHADGRRHPPPAALHLKYRGGAQARAPPEFVEGQAK
jgi:hypothetical protein